MFGKQKIKMMTLRPVVFLLYYSLVALLAIVVIECQVKDPLRDTPATFTPKREHTLTKPYQGAGMTIPNWEFFGSTIVTNNYIRLTQDAQSRQGGIWNSMPYRSKYWQVEVGFRIHGQGTELYGDGFAIWYVRDPPQVGPVFGNQDYFTGMGIFFDTYANQQGVHSHGHPYISGMINNGTMHYDHDMDGTHSELAGCECKFRGSDHETRALITYYNDEITIKIDVEGDNEWHDCFKVTGVYLPPYYYFGITAATGDLSDNHDILYVKAAMLSPPIYNYAPKDDDLPKADAIAPPSERLESHSSGMPALRRFFMIVCIGAAIIAVCGFGYFLYTSQLRNTRKRLY
ncbi:VIP36-like protein [Fragariocoptes setiger]|uniref:VIP36-like protein n=1 Tax=Fragariocoptes setiger TaxID=1670756 RepID=A0ABQ7SBA0_9ACAR|nr:VIP36-like protein [Fragariocoptes setiger]